MELIDEEGNLFGVVNVIDALVVLMAVAVVGAGVAVLGHDSESATNSTTTQFVTIDLNEQPGYVAERISEGDVMTRDGQNLTITDVYVGPGGGETASMTIRAKVAGTVAANGPVSFGGDVIRPGRPIQVQTGDYGVNGTVTAVEDDGSELDVVDTSVTLRTTVDRSIGHRIREGDTYEVGGRQVATVDSVRVYPTNNTSQNRALLDVTLRTLRSDDGTMFGSVPVKVGSTVPVRTDEYDVTGTVIEKGGPETNRSTETLTATVELENVDPEYAAAFEVGDEERFRDDTYARVTDKRVEPAVVVVASDDGNIHEREHPRNKDVYLTVELNVRVTSAGIQFHGERLSVGSSVILDFGSVVAHGNVTEIEDP